MSGRPRKHQEPDPHGWLFTFSDVVTLVLTFFVMMLAFRQPDLARYQAAFGGLAARQEQAAPAGQGASQAAGQGAGQGTGREAGPIRAVDSLLASGPGAKAPAEEQAEGPPGLAQELELPLGRGGFPSGTLQKGVTVREDPRGTAITLANDLLFAPGSAWLPPEAAARIGKVAELLRHGRQPIIVEGHTDDQPLPPAKAYQDNWDLSLARAVAVAQQLAAAGGLDSSRLRVAALGGSRPLAPNDSPGNQGKNRRTEIVILTEGG
ncbi:MAG: flagellar motor protein MotB [Desulfarculus sp.]|nr:flagellar motor protein MotB [Desulfarculus sp.]